MVRNRVALSCGMVAIDRDRALSIEVNRGVVTIEVIEHGRGRLSSLERIARFGSGAFMYTANRASTMNSAFCPSASRLRLRGAPAPGSGQSEPQQRKRRACVSSWTFFGRTLAAALGYPDELSRLESADDLEVLVDEDVVRPVDADVVDVVLAVAQLHNPRRCLPGRRLAQLPSLRSPLLR